LKQSHKVITLYLVLLAVALAVFQLVSKMPQSVADISFSDFKQAVEKGQVASVTVRGNRIEGDYVSEQTVPVGSGAEKRELKVKKFKSLGPELNDDFVGYLSENKVGQVKFMPEEGSPFWQTLLVSWLPIILLVLLFVFFIRQVQSGGGKALQFGKSKARLLTERQSKATFADVAGIDEAKDELQEIIEFLKDPKKFTKLGGRIPKGVLLVGPPGTGKTLLARAIAGEAGVPFFSISGSDFVEMFVGVGASRVRDLFDQGKKHAPCIIFIDEIDAVGRHRGAGLGGGHDEREQTLNQLLVEMDGFESNEGVILISATNRPDVLDPALLRPGRFDRTVVVPRPDVKGRLGILKVHTKKTPLGPEVDLDKLARGTPGFSGADLENLVNEAALAAARIGKKMVGEEDFEKAKDKVLLGTERKSLIISEEEKICTAYHEGGHALVAKLLPGTDPVHKVSIIPRGMALGVTQLLPKEDKYNLNREYAQNQIAYLMGGRCAEELKLNTMSTGAGNDLERATEMGRKMVCEWGMSEKLGPLTYGKREEHIFLGKEFARHQDYSEKTAQDIDSEVSRIVTAQYQRAKEILRTNLDKLHLLAEALLEYEVLEGEEVDLIIAGQDLPKRTRNSAPKGAVPEAAEPAAKVSGAGRLVPETGGSG
jgi:cell division protease FtsH